MSTRYNLNKVKNQSGAALLTALSFLVVITLISVSAMRSSTSELRMASNHEDRMAADQVAQAAVDVVINDPLNFAVTGTSGTEKTNAVLSGVGEFNHANIIITELDTMIPPRGLGVSADKFQTTLFDIYSNYNNVANGRGQTRLAQGFLLLVPKL